MSRSIGSEGGRVRKHVSPSLVISVIALVVALSGTAVASSYIITKTSQIKPSVRHALKGQRGAEGDTGPQGPMGLSGAAGPAGPAGAAGLLGVTAVDGPERTYQPGEYGGAPVAQCPAGSTVIGTGFNGPFDAVGGFVKKYGTFVGGFFENSSSIALTGSVQAICAQLPPGATAASLRRVATQKDRFADDVRQAAAAVAAGND